MREEQKAKAALSVLAICTGTGIAAGLRAATGFDVAGLDWWQWLVEYWLTQGYPPLAETTVVGVGLVVGVSACAAVPWRVNSTIYGKAAWANSHDLKAAAKKIGLRWSRRPAQGVVLGIWRGRVLSYSKAVHTMLFGPSRWGKTAGVIIPSVLNNPGKSVVVNDPSGDIAAATMAFRQTCGPCVKLVWDGPSADQFNPIGRGSLPVDRAAMGDLVDRQAVALVGDQENFWNKVAADGLAAATLFQIFTAENRGEDATYAGVLSYLSSLRVDGAELDGQDDPARLVLTEHADQATAAGMPARVSEGLLRLAANDAKTRANILATIFAGLRVFSSDYVRATTASNSFDLRSIRGPRPLTVYCVCSPAAQAAYGPITALFLECVYQVLTERLPQKNELGCVLLLDELGFIPPVDLVRRGPAILAKYDVTLVLGFQDRGQPEAAYGRHSMTEFDTNTSLKVVLTLNEPTSAKWVETMVGPYTAKRISSSLQQSTDKIGAGSVSSQYEGRPLVTAQDVMSMPFGEHVVLIQGIPHRPVQCRGAMAHEVRFFRRRLTPPPEKPRA